MTPSSIVVVAPHSHCGSAAGRDCDRVAAEVAADLAPRVAAVHLADRLRMYGDYNRDGTYWSAWREQLRALIAKTGASFMLEVHSFPANSPGWIGADLVLFASPFNAPWIGRLAATVRDAAPWLDVRIAEAGRANSIMYEFGPVMGHVLAEFNEGRPHADAARALLDAIERLPPMAAADGAKKAEIAAMARVFVALLVAVLIMALVAWLIVYVLGSADTNDPSQRCISLV